MRRIAILGSHGLFANYGGWDQLVNNLALKKSADIHYLIFNSVESSVPNFIPDGVTVKRIRLKATGFQGIFYDFWSILLCFWKVDTLLLLGVQGIPLIRLIFLFRKVRIVSNVGGIEWERPKFNFIAKQYLKYCFKLSFKLSKHVILDNPYYTKYIPAKSVSEISILPYGGEIDDSLEVTDQMLGKYPFLKDEFYLSISRSLRDNLIEELCASFVHTRSKLVLISNFSRSEYGRKVLEKYKNESNLLLINGLYVKPELDLIRRKCKAYIHTHTLCGTAPSLVEMIIARKPIISIDNPQNRYTLNNEGVFYTDFTKIQHIISTEDLRKFIPSSALCEIYNWNKIVTSYESLY